MLRLLQGRSPLEIPFQDGFDGLYMLLAREDPGLANMLASALAHINPKLAVPDEGRVLRLHGGVLDNVRGAPEKIDWLLVSENVHDEEQLVPVDTVAALTAGRALSGAHAHRIVVMCVGDVIYICIRACPLGYDGEHA